MSILVTGASGLLGYALAKRLAEDGSAVRVLLRKPDQAELFRGMPVESVQGALEDVASLKRAVDGVEEIYHCAATSTDWAPWDVYYAGNVAGVANLLGVAKEQPSLKRFLHVSSTDVYGYPKTVCDEDGPLVDAGLPYNRSKVLGEKLVWAASREGLPVTVIRPATIYGPRDTDFGSDVYFHLKKGDMPLIAGGQSAPGLLFIENAVDGLIAAARSDNTIGKAYNLRDETAESWQEYFDAFADKAGEKRTTLRLPFFFAYAMGWTCEQLNRIRGITSKPLLTRHSVLLMSRDAAFPIDRAKWDFGFKSRITFDQGVAAVVDWVKTEEGDVSPERQPAPA
jgi:nucleoside-diphosphate-sugar epimerase